jgi:hypothetical protein
VLVGFAAGIALLVSIAAVAFGQSDGFNGTPGADHVTASGRIAAAAAVTTSRARLAQTSSASLTAARSAPPI